MSQSADVIGLFDRAILLRAARDSLIKLNPRQLIRNPVIFTTEIIACLVSVVALHDLLTGRPAAFSLVIAAWLWITVLFATFAEAVAEGRGRVRADSLRRARSDTMAKLLLDPRDHALFKPTPAAELHKDDLVLVEQNDIIPSDGTIIEGIASVNESAITGESAPVIREAGGDRSAVTGGTQVVSDFLVIRITAEPGATFLDRMIALVEGAERRKTPNEIALALLLAGLSLIFLFVVVTLAPFSVYSHAPVSVTILIALLVAMIPTTIGGLLSAIGISGMNRLLAHNVLALSGRAVEAAGDVNVVMLDKTGTLTLGARQATTFVPARGVTELQLAEAAQLSSLADETPEGRSVVILAKRFGLREVSMKDGDFEFVGFSAQTRMSGVNIGKREIRKGAVTEVAQWSGAEVDNATREAIDGISRAGGTPLLVAEQGRIMGVIHLQDIIKEGMKERLSSLREAGIKTVMITGDNPVTARAIAEEVGVDDFLAEATPERKMEYVKSVRAEGYMVGMVGDGTNDAPALAHADVAVAMNTGTMAAREAGNMIDLDSNPAKLIEIVEVGKQILITRGALTTFSIVNDVAKYFAIIPAMFVVAFPGLKILNIMHLTSPETAILSAIIFNALIIPALIPLALRGVNYHATSASAILRRNLLVYGLGGLIVPFIGIKLIDIVVTNLHLVSTL